MANRIDRFIYINTHLDEINKIEVRKMNMEYSSIRLNDLLDEILMIIFKKLNNLDVLYSMIGVNKRLNQIVKDSIFTNDFALVFR